jgi:hypothetical protein
MKPTDKEMRRLSLIQFKARGSKSFKEAVLKGAITEEEADFAQRVYYKIFKQVQKRMEKRKAN